MLWYDQGMSWKIVSSIFIVYSILGWGVDTFVRSIQAGHYVFMNILGIPFSPMYGCGALLVLWINRYIQQWQMYQQFVCYFLMLGTYEYFGGVLSEWLLGYRLWEYSHIPLNVHGHTDVFHAIAWAVLALCVVRVFHPFLQKHVLIKKRPTQ